MTSDDRLERIRDIAERVSSSYGLQVFDVKLRRESIGWVLRVVLDRQHPDGADIPTPIEQGVSVEDCQRVSQDLSAILDVEDAVDQSYTLEVSSPGLDRPLRSAADYRRFNGRLAKIVVAEAIEGRTHFAGRLKGMEDDAVLLEDAPGRIHRIPLSGITRARLEVEFRR